MCDNGQDYQKELRGANRAVAGVLLNVGSHVPACGLIAALGAPCDTFPPRARGKAPIRRTRARALHPPLASPRPRNPERRGLTEQTDHRGKQQPSRQPRMWHMSACLKAPCTRDAIDTPTPRVRPEPRADDGQRTEQTKSPHDAGHRGDAKTARLSDTIASTARRGRQRAGRLASG